MPRILFFIPIIFILIFGCLKKKCNDVLPVTKITPVVPCIPYINNWLNEFTVGSTSLNNVYFLNSKTGWLSGGNGTILKTTDSGSTFINQSSGTTQMLTRISFLDEQIGYAAGGNSDPNGVVLKSTNGGTSWSTILSSIEAVRGMFFFNKDTGFVVGSFGSMRKTENGGNTWNSVNAGTSSSFYDIEFVSKDVGYACGSFGMIIKTIDGGQTWTGLSNNMPQQVNNAYYALDFIDANNGYVVGYAASSDVGFILKTTNGGNSWTYINIFSSEFTDVISSDINIAYIAEGKPGAAGSIFKIDNLTINKDKSLSKRLNGISYAGCNNAFATGESGISIKAD